MFNSSSNINSGSDFELPGEILNVLPMDPYEQLDLARKITSIAVGTRVSRLEAEAAKLRRKIEEKDHVIHGLHEKIAQLEQKLDETNEQLSFSKEDQAKLVQEKNALAGTVKKLNRDVAKLETFKKTLVQSLQDQDENSQQTVFTESTATKRAASPISSSLASRDEDSSILNERAYLVSNAHSVMGSSLAEDENKAEAHGRRKGFLKELSTMTNTTPPHVTPTESPKRASPSHSPKQNSTSSPKGACPTTSPKHHSSSTSPRRHSASISPTRHQFEGRVSFYSSLPASSHATAPNSPPHSGSHSARGTRMDGKEFFRQARSRLSFEQFSAFLANIKELNSHKQTREETLRKADEIFGPDNKDLYVIFDGLLSKHLP